MVSAEAAGHGDAVSIRVSCGAEAIEAPQIKVPYECPDRWDNALDRIAHLE